MPTKTNRSFHFWVILISLIGGIVRYVNITYSSMWGDELYSMFSVHPSNSWYEVLYWQRAYQPPLYFMVLWVWVKLFAFNEFYGRLLSVVAGMLCITVSGYLGKKVKNEWVGIGMAILVAFSSTQIWYSLEARFYVFVYLFAALSLIVYWHIIQTQTRKPLIYLTKSVVDATLCYFHHFGIVFVFAQFCFDCYLFYKNRNKAVFIRSVASYALAAALYAPWAFWGLLQGLAIKDYWLKEINVAKYILFSIDYPVVLQAIALLLMAVFLWIYWRKKEDRHYMIFPFVTIVLIVVPVVYSLIRIPILVDRYSFVIAPALYVMMLTGLYELLQMFRQNALLKKLATVTAIVAFSFSGLYMSFVAKDKLLKHPWRQMATWLKQQPDYKEALIYNAPASYKDFLLLDFYFDRPFPSRSVYDLKPGEDRKMYLVESSSVWVIKKELLDEVYKQYNVTKVPFQETHSQYGNIYVCTKK
jgi:mannosyltransferase